jgi:MtN3 and saliva related transmembrane protein
MTIPANYIGIAAGVFTGISMLPQLVMMLKEKKADGISPGMLVVLMIGLALWVWCGIERTDWPVIITNAFSFLVNMMVLLLVIIYRKKKQPL